MDPTRDGYTISTDRSRLDLDTIHRFLSREAYWSLGLPRDVMERSFENSMCFGLFDSSGAQAGFARVITDRATFAYLGDVFVLEEHRGRGLGKWMVETVMAHPDLRGLRRFVLATADAHSLYSRHGFARLSPEGVDRLMALDRDPAELWGPPGAV